MNTIRATSDPYTLQFMQLMFVPDNVPGKAGALNQLGDIFKERFQVEKDPFDIDKALMAYAAAVDLTPRAHRDYSLFLYDIGTARRIRFEALGEIADIDKSIATHHSVVNLVTPGHANYPVVYTGLGNAYLRRFQHKGDMADIDEAIQSLETAETFTPKDDSEYPLVQNDLANAYLCRSQFNHSIDDIQNALVSYTRALEQTPPNHPMMRSLFRSMGNALVSRFKVEGNLQDLEDAVRAHRSAVALTPQGHWYLPLVLDDLGGSILCRFRRLGKKEDLDEVISLRRRAISIAEETDHKFYEYLHTLAITLLCQFQRYGHLQDIDEAIELLRSARSLVADGKIIVTNILHDLATCLSCRFTRLGKLPDIEEAIVFYKEAIALTPPDHTKIAERRSSLGDAYQSRFEHSRELADIDTAISLHREAVDEIIEENDSRIAFLLSGIGRAYISRFQHTYDLNDISIANSSFKEAVDITPDSSPNLPVHLTNLGISEMSFFDHDTPSSRLAHAERAIECLSKALDLIPDDHSTRPENLTNLANVYNNRFSVTRDPNDIDASINLGRRALASTQPEPSASRFCTLFNLGASLGTRFEESGDFRDLEEAIQLLEEAEKGVPEGYKDLTALYTETGRAYFERFLDNDDEEDYQKAVTAFRKALTMASSAAVRIRSSLTWASCAYSHEPLDALEPYKAALDLLSQIVWLGQPMAIRHSRIPSISHVAREAAAAAISVGKYELALEWLEQGRGIIWSQFDHLRTSFEDVKKVDEELGAELSRVARALDASTFRVTELAFWKSIVEKVDMHDQIKAGHDLARTWESLVDKVRQISGFEEFLKPATFTQLVKSLKCFPVVVLNVHSTRCDALVLTGKNDAPVIHIPLKSFSLDCASKLRHTLTSSLQSKVRQVVELDTRAGRPSAFSEKQVMKDALLELWVSLAKPIVDALGYQPCVEPPRIWWCPTGPLSFLPIHAAGDYGSAATVPGSFLSDYVISSYLPTISSGMQKTPDQSKRSFTGLLVVSQASAPSLPPLPNVQKEVRVIQDQFPSSTHCTNLDGKAAMIDAVLENMEKNSWVHFACHASQDNTSPAQSSFHLDDGALYLSTLIRKAIPGADFAYLSACQTVRGDEHLSEEAVHLAGGMLAAGYKSVIATMWSIGDDEAPIVAQEVYRNAGRDSSRSAWALHCAIRKLRRALGDGEDVMYKWVPYVHIGV